MPNLLSQTQLIRKVLNPAVRFWLKQQVEQVESLDFELKGSDRQLLAGQIPTVRVAAQKVVYQGIPLTEVEILGEAIAIDLKQILQGQPLQLLQPLTVRANLRVSETDLNAAFVAPLLANALKSWFNQGLRLIGQSFQLEETPTLRLGIQQDYLQIEVDSPQADGSLATFAMQAMLTLQPPQCLLVTQPRWVQAPPWASTDLSSLEGLVLDLGQDVALEHLAIETGWIQSRGQIVVRP